MKSILYGAIVSVLTITIMRLTKDIDTALNVTFITGVVIWIISGLLTGSFISGDRSRANYHQETEEDRTSRVKQSQFLFLFGLPFIVMGITVYLIVK
ncbi:hypothetical protein J2Z32_002660 [Paenibacillus turicensis]|uniref:DUF5316 domain-containing protein n=1 Tax=Paenibacillus turicensis TaxID=160487 RepID=A0ABS4FTV7_9BACL|nr:DUF5316 domain-containing protein [Paenibacillus turicensis]MBP1906011.1 hypothetical protein [Paenibacillus turicensis]